MKQVNDELLSLPTGRLETHVRKNHFEYSHTQPDEQGKRRTQFITKENIQMARTLARRDYDEKLKRDVETRLTLLKWMLARYPSGELTDIYDSLPPARKIFEPIVETDDEYVTQWLASHRGGQNSIEKNSGYATEKGDIVRSKSEKIIAETLARYDVPYVYEPTLTVVLNDRRMRVTPDFWALNKHTRRAYIFEHFGMMHNPEYASKAISKLNAYQLNGYWIGENLLVTFESADRPLNVQVVEGLVEKYLARPGN